MPPRKKPGAAIKAQGEDEDGFAPTLSSKSDIEPVKYPPLDPFPVPSPLTADALSFAETSRRLRENTIFSGYRITNQPINQAASQSTNPPVNQTVNPICSVPIVRYSDKYRRRIGVKRLRDEITQPSPLVFPPEILRSLYQSSSSPSNNQSTSQSIEHFMSAHMIEASLERLVTQSAVSKFEATQARADAAKTNQLSNSNGQNNEDDDDASEDGRASGEDVDEVDEEDEGDYAQRYQEDDDGEGGEGVWGEDEGEVF